MFYQGKIYKVRRASEALKIVYEQLLRDYMTKRENPLQAFLEGLVDLDQPTKNAAIAAFVATKRDTEYSDVMRLQAQNTLDSVQFLVANLIPDFDHPVTDDNKSDLLKAMQIHHTDPDRERIDEIRGMRNGTE